MKNKTTTVVVKQGVRFLNKLGNFAFQDNKTGLIAFTGEYSTTYAIAITGQTKDTRGGKGNALIMQSHSDRNVAVTLTIKEWNLEYIAATQGSTINYDFTELFVIEDPINVDSAGKAVLNTPTSGVVSVKFPDNRRVNVPAAADGVTLDLSSYDIADVCVTTTYPFIDKAKTVTITADGTPFIGRLLLEGTISDSLVGNVGTVTVDIPSFACSDQITITFNADGTTSDTQMQGVALSVNGQSCADGMVYGYVKEYVADDVAPQLVGIIASPSPIELNLAPTPETQTISVYGDRGVMYTEILITNDQCTFVASEPTVASVSAAGVVTAVGAGTTTITVTYTAGGLTDDVQVTVK